MTGPGFNNYKHSIRPTHDLLDSAFNINEEIKFELSLLSTDQEKEKRLWDFCCQEVFPVFISINEELEKLMKSWIDQKINSLA